MTDLFFSHPLCVDFDSDLDDFGGRGTLVRGTKYRTPIRRNQAKTSPAARRQQAQQQPSPKKRVAGRKARPKSAPKNRSVSRDDVGSPLPDLDDFSSSGSESESKSNSGSSSSSELSDDESSGDEEENDLDRDLDRDLGSGKERYSQQEDRKLRRGGRRRGSSYDKVKKVR